jgi:hypothetical protein
MILNPFLLLFSCTSFFHCILDIPTGLHFIAIFGQYISIHSFEIIYLLASNLSLICQFHVPHIFIYGLYLIVFPVKFHSSCRVLHGRTEPAKSIHITPKFISGKTITDKSTDVSQRTVTMMEHCMSKRDMYTIPPELDS